MKPVKMQWTLVQHSGCGYGSDVRFARAVQMELITTTAEFNRVQKAGGLLFDEYDAASHREELENYPPEVKGLVPRCRGRFARAKINGLKIYVPLAHDPHTSPA